MGNHSCQAQVGAGRTIVKQWHQLRTLPEDSPSLVQRVPEAMSMELPAARELAPSDLAEFNAQPPAAKPGRPDLHSRPSLGLPG